MAEVVIKVSDKEDGGVDFNIDFNPAIKENDEYSSAQIAAMIMVEALKENCEEFKDIKAE